MIPFPRERGDQPLRKLEQVGKRKRMPRTADRLLELWGETGEKPGLLVVRVVHGHTGRRVMEGMQKLFREKVVMPLPAEVIALMVVREVVMLKLQVAMAVICSPPELAMVDLGKVPKRAIQLIPLV